MISSSKRDAFSVVESAAMATKITKREFMAEKSEEARSEQLKTIIKL